MWPVLVKTMNIFSLLSEQMDIIPEKFDKKGYLNNHIFGKILYLYMWLITHAQSSKVHFRNLFQEISCTTFGHIDNCMQHFETDHVGEIL